MQIGTQIFAPDGYEVLSKGRVYHLLLSDQERQRVLLLEFRAQHEPQCSKAGEAPQLSLDKTLVAAHRSRTKPEMRPCLRFRPVVHYMSRHSFEVGIDDGHIFQCEQQAELPPWLSSMTVADLRTYADQRGSRKKSHDQRIDQILEHLWPLVQELHLVLATDSPDQLINAHARACQPKQNETRFRSAFYAYVCFGLSRWALHYAVNQIGRWDRTGHKKKLGRPSRLRGAHHGYATNDPRMIENMLVGYRKFAGAGRHLSRIYRETLVSVFGCVVYTEPSGKKAFIHPNGNPFPSLAQFAYRIAKEYPLEIRQTYKYGHSRVRNKLKHSQGRFAESVGNLMERTEQDAYCCDQVAQGYLPGSHLPALWVVRIRCIASGMIVGVGFSFGSETAAAYRMAQFCAAIGKVKFCSLFGITIKNEDWPSVGVSPHVINDRGPGSTAKADAANPSLRPIIKEAAPSYSGQSKASVETTHPKLVKTEGKPRYRETRLSIPQIAAQEILRAVADNHSLDVSDRLNNDVLGDGIFPTSATLWHYLDRKGRNHGILVEFESAIRAYLTPVDLTVRDDAVYFRDARFHSEQLKNSGVLQKAHALGRYALKGFILDVCVRHLWVDLGTELVEVDAMLGIRDGQEQLYISVLEIEQLQQLRRDAKLELKQHRLAAKSEYEAAFEAYTGIPFEQAETKAGRSRRGKENSQKDKREIIDYLRAGGRR